MHYDNVTWVCVHYDNVTWVCVHYDNVTCVCVHHVTLRVYMTVCAYMCVTLWCECLCVCVPQRMSGFVHVARSCMNAVLLCKTSVIHIKNMDGGMHYYEALMIIII